MGEWAFFGGSKSIFLMMKCFKYLCRRLIFDLGSLIIYISKKTQLDIIIINISLFSLDQSCPKSRAMMDEMRLTQSFLSPVVNRGNNFKKQLMQQYRYMANKLFI